LVYIFVMTNSNIKKNSKKWTDIEEALLKEKASFYTVKELMAFFPDRTKDGIAQRLLRLKIKAKKGVHAKAWSEEDKDYLCKNYSTAKWEDLCKILKRSPHTISEYARKRGLKMAIDENGDTANTVGSATLRPLLDGSLQSAYWMGYLMADGYMHHGLGQIVLVSAEADKDHMEKYANYLKSKLHCYTAPGGYTGIMTPHYRVSVAEYRIAKQIAQKFDWKNKKTYNPPNANILFKAFDSNDHFLAFMIGFFDGDGNIGKESQVIRVENHASWLKIHQLMLDFARKLGHGQGSKDARINGDGYSYFMLPKTFTKYCKSFILKHNLFHLNRKWDKIQNN